MPGSDARRIDWTIGGIAGHREWRLGAQLIWSPVKCLTIGAEGMCENTRNTLAGLGTNTPQPDARRIIPASSGEFASTAFFDGQPLVFARLSGRLESC